MRKYLENNTKKWWKVERLMHFYYNFYWKITIPSEVMKNRKKLNINFSMGLGRGSSRIFQNYFVEFGGGGIWGLYKSRVKRLTVNKFKGLTDNWETGVQLAGQLDSCWTDFFGLPIYGIFFICIDVLGSPSQLNIY